MNPSLAFRSSRASQLASGAALTGDGRLFFTFATSAALPLGATKAAVLVFPPPGKGRRLLQSRRDVPIPSIGSIKAMVAPGSLVVRHRSSRSSPSLSPAHARRGVSQPHNACAGDPSDGVVHRTRGEVHRTYGA